MGDSRSSSSILMSAVPAHVQIIVRIVLVEHLRNEAPDLVPVYIVRND